MKILLDQNAPRGLRRALAPHEVRTALQLGWDEVVNGALIAAAEKAGFDVLFTCDQSIAYQNNLAGRKLALVVLENNTWHVIRRKIETVISAVGAATPGSFVSIPFKLPQKPRPLPSVPTPDY